MLQTRSIEPRFAVFAGGYIAAILYGSLFPFRYQPEPDAIRVLLSSTHYVGTVVDVTANVLFYIPLGLLIVLSLRLPSVRARIAAAVGSGFLLSTIVELLQAHIPGRISNLSDVYANTAGAFAGAYFIRIWPRVRATRSFAALNFRPYPAMLLITWIAARTFSYEPPVDPVHFGYLVDRVIAVGNLQPLALFHWFALWIAAGTLIAEMTRRLRTLYIAFAGFVALTVGGQMLFGYTTFSAEEAWTSILVAAILWVLRSPSQSKFVAMAALIVTLDVVTDALRPFHFSSIAGRFHLVPFRGFLEASRANSVTVLFQKIFAYGVLVWIWMRAGWRWAASTVFSTAIVLIVRLIQVYLPGRSAEITDALMVVGMAYVMRLLREDYSLGFDSNRYPTPRTVSK